MDISAVNALSWPHEAFALKFVAAGTLSRHRAPVARSSLFDSRCARDSHRAPVIDAFSSLAPCRRRLRALTAAQPTCVAAARGARRRAGVASATLARNVRVAADALALHMYRPSASNSSEPGASAAAARPPLDVFRGSLDVDASALDDWVSALLRVSRHLPDMTGRDNGVMEALYSAVGGVTTDAAKAPFPVDPAVMRFYTPGTATLSVSRGKGALFDVYLALAVGAWVALVYAAVTVRARAACVCVGGGGGGGSCQSLTPPPLCTRAQVLSGGNLQAAFSFSAGKKTKKARSS